MVSAFLHSGTIAVAGRIGRITRFSIADLREWIESGAEPGDRSCLS